MNKLITIAAILSLALVTSMVLIPTGNAMPGIKRPMDFYVATIQGGSPQTVDYSWAYDTASGEIIFNTMDTLIMFNAEHTDQFIGNIATTWSIVNLGAGVNSGIPIAGLNFENPANQTGTAKYYYRYVFGIDLTPPIYFQTFPNGTQGYPLTVEDIVYSFQRTLVQDRLSGPSWMLYEPLLDNPVDADQNDGGVADLTDPTQVGELGQLIANAVQVNPSNSSEIWFNIMFPSSYSPFLGILTQTWSSIVSKKWILNEVISQAGRPDWDGDWSTYTDWVNYHNPTVSPLDNPTPMNYGSGPFCLVPGCPDYVNNFWAMTRYIGYHGGWPASFPTPSSPNLQGYVNTVEETWNFAWAAASQLFKNGDADFVAVPSLSFINELYQSSTPPFDPPNYPLQGIRCIHPLPNLSVDAMFFTFDIATNTLYQPLSDVGVFDANAIPPDFFGNATWGIHVRRAFAALFDYSSFLAIANLGEGTTQPDVATAIIAGLRYYNKTLSDAIGYSYNLNKAKAEFNQVPGLNTTGFTLNLVYNTGNLERKTACDLIQTALTTINPLYKTVEINVDWNPYLTAAVYNQMPLFIIGWLVDFPDVHDFTLPFYHTGGAFASWQAYSNSTIDALVEKGILTPDDLTPYSSAPGHHERQDVYNDIAKAVIQDVPSVTIIQGVGRHFERDWVNGWYYNQAYPGGYYYNRWKWYYITPALYNVSYTFAGLNQPNSTNLPADVTYDGKVDITDVATVAKAFGSIYGPPISLRWVFRGDLNNDRKIDITDVATCAKQFGKKATPQPGTWVPQGLLVTVVPVVRTMAAGSSQQFNSTVIGGTAPYSYAWYVNLTGDPKSTPPVATTANYVFTSPGNGVYVLKLYVNDTGNVNKGESTNIYVTSAPLTVTVDPAGTTLNMTRKERGDFYSTADGGTTPYAYLWFTKNDTGVHDWVIAFATTYGNDASQYRFSSRAGQGSDSPGTWELKVQVTDDRGAAFAVNSTASIITVVK
jgi:peptide/nickel transport system substrate-binding protein